jgi:ubiquinone/menaquinone biosynthesis C-methylase UbiE
MRGLHEGMFGLAHHAGWYDRIAGRLNGPLYRHVAADVADADLPSGAVVLDVGTGPGRVPLLIAERCPHVRVEGIDLSDEMIQQARTRATAAMADDRVRYAVADVAALPYPDHSVDLVVSTLSLHHWADIPAGLGEIRRVLKPGGSAWIYDIKRVLNRVATRATANGMTAGVEPFGRPSTGRTTPASLLAQAAGRFLGRLRIQA